MFVPPSPQVQSAGFVVSTIELDAGSAMFQDGGWGNASWRGGEPSLAAYGWVRRE